MRAIVRKRPTEIALADIDEPLVLAFLPHLERDRRNTPRTRNARLAAIRLPTLRRAENPLIPPVDLASARNPHEAFRSACARFPRTRRDHRDHRRARPSDWTGRRDHAMLATFPHTGARVSEITGAHVADVAHRAAVAFMSTERGARRESSPSGRGPAGYSHRGFATSRPPTHPSSRAQRWPAVEIESRRPTRPGRRERGLLLPSLRGRRISPHTLRHTTAMHLLQSGVDVTVIALWLGHESPATTHMYIEADLAMKKRALDKLAEPRRTRPQAARAVRRAPRVLGRPVIMPRAERRPRLALGGGRRAASRESRGCSA